MKDLIVVTTPTDDTQATLTVTKLIQKDSDLFINAYPFHSPGNHMQVGQQVKAKHYPDPDFKLTHTYRGTIKDLSSTKRIVKIHIQLNNEPEPITTQLKGVYRWMTGVFRSPES